MDAAAADGFAKTPDGLRTACCVTGARTAGHGYATQPEGRQADRQTGRQADRQADRQTDRQTDIKTGRQTDRQADRTDRQAGRQTDRQTDRQAGRQTGRQADRQTDRQTDRQAGRQAVLGREVVIPRSNGIRNRVPTYILNRRSRDHFFGLGRSLFGACGFIFEALRDSCLLQPSFGRDGSLAHTRFHIDPHLVSN